MRGGAGGLMPPAGAWGGGPPKSLTPQCFQASNAPAQKGWRCDSTDTFGVVSTVTLHRPLSKQGRHIFIPFFSRQAQHQAVQAESRRVSPAASSPGHSNRLRPPGMDTFTAGPLISVRL